MKKAFYPLLFLLILATTIAIAQTVGSKSPGSVKKKYTYSTVYFNDYWDKIGGDRYQCWANGGDYISSALMSSVGKCTDAVTALNLMGNDNWELVTAYDQAIQFGTQYTYIFKKEQ